MRVRAWVCACVCLHWRPLWLHSSFQQSTMGNWELLHHLVVLVYFVAESWPISSASSSHSISTTHTLCSLLYSDDKACQSQTLLHRWCISNTRLCSFPPPALVSSGMKVRGAQTFHTEEFHNSFIFRAVVPGYAYVLWTLSWCNVIWCECWLCPHTEKKCGRKRKWENIWGVDGAVKTG